MQRRLPGKTHPNLQVEYFDCIDTKEKAYWLGFLYADGYIDRAESRVRLKLACKDGEWVERWATAIGANKESINRGKEPGDPVGLTIGCKKMVAALVKHGCVNRKSSIIRLPSFATKELDLAFLMGFFDGDGSEINTELVSGSRLFLEDIVEKYGLGCRITQGKGQVWGMHLGAVFFRQMLANFPESMPRKRCTHSGQLQWFRQGLISSVPGEFEASLQELKLQRKKEQEATGKRLRFVIDLEYIREALKSRSIDELAKEIGISGVGLAKRRRKAGIPLPPRGYWTKQRALEKRL